MIANDELQEYMCKKYKHRCSECSASGVAGDCGFDGVDSATAEYVEDMSDGAKING